MRIQMLSLVHSTVGLVSVAIMAAVSAHAAAPRYAVTPITSDWSGAVEAYALNDSAQVTGQANGDASLPGTHMFLWQPGSPLQILDTVFDLSEGVKINESGQIAGTADFCPPVSGPCTATIVRYTPGVGLEDLGTLGGTGGTVQDMNDQGRIIGRWASVAPLSNYHAFLYSDENGLQDLDQSMPFNGYGYFRAEDINNLGVIAGYAYIDGAYQAYVWSNGTATPLGTLGGSESTAYYIADTGATSGWSDDASGAEFGFIWTPDNGLAPAPQPAGAVTSRAHWVTSSGVVVGTWQDGAAVERLYIYTPTTGVQDIGPTPGLTSTAWTGIIAVNDAGETIVQDLDPNTYEAVPRYFSSTTGLHNLNDLLAEPVDSPLQVVSDINSRGQITAYGNSGSVLLTPIIEGDMNCDGQVNFSDINGFVDALLTPATFAAENPNCPLLNADINASGNVDYADINAFVALLFN